MCRLLRRDRRRTQRPNAPAARTGDETPSPSPRLLRAWPRSVPFASGSLAHPFNKLHPHAPRDYNHRVGAVLAQEQRIVFAKPILQRYETAAVLASFHLRRDRRLIGAKHVDVDVMAAAAKPAGARQRITLGMD